MPPGSFAHALDEASPGLPQSASEADRVAYARDLWPRHHLAVRDGAVASHRPASIVWPRSTEEVAAVVARCAREGVPLVPFGAGSGVCGGVLPDARTVVMDLKRLGDFRVERAGGPVVVAGAGAMGIRLEEDLAAQGYTLGHFPSSILCSTVGGWVAARSAGQCSGRYGKIEDMVASMEVVWGDGQITTLHRRTRGPDLTPLWVGSEGVLGVITRATLRIVDAPEARTLAAFSFPTAEVGFEGMRALYQAGLRPAVCRLYDPFDSWMAKRGKVRRAASTGAARKGDARRDLERLGLRTALRLPAVLNGFVERMGERAFGGAMLVLVFEGGREDGRADRERARQILARIGAEDLGEAPAERWLAHRYGVSYRQAPVFMSGAFSDTMEVAAPWSRLEALYHGVRLALRDHVFVMAHLSHAYPDGCSIYFTFAGSAPTREASETLYDTTWRAALAAALEAGGTVSHHHGVGRSKAPALGEELGLGVPLVHAVRRAADPAGIFNPGNLLPRDPPRRAAAPSLPAPELPRFDETSLLVHANGASTLGSLEELARARGLTLGVRDLAPTQRLDAWIDQGMPGAPDPWLDPVDHVVAGFTAELASGDVLAVRPGPRRAVGPDTFALFQGMGGRVGRVTSAHVRLHRAGLSARPMPTDVERDPPLGGSESTLLDRVVDEARGARFA